MAQHYKCILYIIVRNSFHLLLILHLVYVTYYSHTVCTSKFSFDFSLWGWVVSLKTENIIGSIALTVLLLAANCAARHGSQVL